MMNSWIDHVFLLFAGQIFIAISAIFVTASQCAKKKATNTPAASAYTLPPTGAPPTAAPLASTATGVGPSVNTALPPAADAKSGMKKPEEKKDDKKSEDKPKSKKEKKEDDKKEDGVDNYEDVAVGDAPPPPA